PRRDRPVGPVRAPGRDQYGLEPALDPDERDDLAVFVLWRVLVAGSRARDGDDAGLDQASAWGEHAMSAPFVLASGGTGGHLFPAEAVAVELLGRGDKVHLFTDSRVETFARRVPEI